jgi:hypothetical protein
MDEKFIKKDITNMSAEILLIGKISGIFHDVVVSCLLVDHKHDAGCYVWIISTLRIHLHYITCKNHTLLILLSNDLVHTPCVLLLSSSMIVHTSNMYSLAIILLGGPIQDPLVFLWHVKIISRGV